MDDETIIQERISGCSVRAIAKSAGVSVTQINEAIDRWAASAIDDKTRKNTLCLELERLDELQRTFYERALAGDVQCGALVTKIIERRCVMLGLATPQTAVLQIVDSAASRETSTERIRKVLDALVDQKTDPSTH
jgi:hypothetical protein